MTRPLILFAAAALLAGGCVSDRIGQGKPPVPPPPAAPDATPKIKDVGNASNAVDASNRELSVKVAELRREASAARVEASAATKRAEVLAKAGSATKEQLEQAWKDLQAMEARNLFLETQSEFLEITVKRQETEIKTLLKANGEAALAVAEVETERDGLKIALKQANENTSAANDRGDKAVQLAEDERTRADKAEKQNAGLKTFRFWTLAIGIGLVSLAGLVLLARIFLPIIIQALRKTIVP